tara:strand:- start:12612 stop:12920 length:309 start_codon:yes stop_codon:yes gene_type:complete
MKPTTEQGKKVFHVYYDGEDFVYRETDAHGVYDVLVDFAVMDNASNGFIWTMYHKTLSQRKFRSLSMTGRSVYVFLDAVKEKLREGEIVYCQTPDVMVKFYS